MVKIITTVGINPELHELAKAKRINVSKLLNDSLCRELGITVETTPEIKEAIEKTYKENIEDFLKNTLPSIVQNPTRIKYWTGITGKTMEELIILKRDYHGGSIERIKQNHPLV